ncbi:hypothetical protein CEXT_501721 [Caerostris extrusa]|uniref:Uncharacterized protein n=1 Tax=Caerostris extrusa TaxID=172846 RepID=A0AAV4V8R7_CAEEX|nr:hypothetical protein CEXT_501721 [Caerostris extrusa]
MVLFPNWSFPDRTATYNWYPEKICTLSARLLEEFLGKKCLTIEIVADNRKISEKAFVKNNNWDNGICIILHNSGHNSRKSQDLDMTLHNN